MNRVTRFFDDTLDWLFDNFASGCLLLFGLAFVVIVGWCGVMAYRSWKSPLSARQVVTKRETQVYVLVGKVAMPVPEYTFVSTDGSTCSVDQLTFETRKVGEIQVCKWVSP